MKGLVRLQKVQLEALQQVCQALELSRAEEKAFKLLLRWKFTSTEKRPPWDDIWQECLKLVGPDVLDVLDDVSDEIWLHLHYLTVPKSKILPGKPKSGDDDRDYESDVAGAQRDFQELLSDKLYPQRLIFARRTDFRSGFEVQIGGVDGEFLHYFHRLEEMFDWLGFELSNCFAAGWEKVFYIFPSELEDGLSRNILYVALTRLFHEVGHCLAQKRYGEDYEDLTKLEQESVPWNLGWEIAQNLGLTQDSVFCEVFAGERECGEYAYAAASVREKKKPDGWQIV